MLLILRAIDSVVGYAENITSHSSARSEVWNLESKPPKECKVVVYH